MIVLVPECDHCRRIYDHFQDSDGNWRGEAREASAAAVRRVIKSAGWTRVNGYDFCPACSTERREAK